jgi:acyl-CoA thioesterase I
VTTFAFAGDSTTDCGRTFFDPDVGAGHLGDGWVRIVAALLGHRRPGRDRFLNAGVSGDRVADLAARWERDVVPHRPEVLTVLIGVNDVLLEPPSPLDEVEAAYRTLLGHVPETVSTLVIADPFALPVVGGEPLTRAVGPLVDLVATIADEVDAVHLPLDGLFAAACARAEPAWWAADGVHPTAAGHGLIAEAWLETIVPAL